MPVGPHRKHELRMFQAIAARRVYRVPYLTKNEKVWREQCIVPLEHAAFSGSCLIADDVPAAVWARYKPAKLKGGEGDRDAGANLALVGRVLEQVPSWRPPFDRMWIEMTLADLPDEARKFWPFRDDSDVGGPAHVEAYGAFVRCAEILDPQDVYDDYPDRITSLPGGPESTRWVVQVDHYAMVNGTVCGPCGTTTHFVGHNGGPAEGMSDRLENDDFDFDYDPSPELAKIRANTPDAECEEVMAKLRKKHGPKVREHIQACLARDRKAITHGLLPLDFAFNAGIALVGFAIGLTHCKNVSAEDATDADRRADPRLPKPGVRYKVLKIRPMVQRKGSIGDDAGEAQPLALHVVRGHFHDYRQGKGLFGKHRGLYWWSPHVRGKAEHGEVVKDYSV